MEIYKKKIIILNKVENKGQGYKGSVLLLRLNDTIKITVDVLSKDSSETENLIWLFSTDKEYLLEPFLHSFRFTKTLPIAFDFDFGASFFIFDTLGGEIISHGEIGSPLITLKTAKDYFLVKKPIEEYDDEIIATENYYKKEDELLRDEIKSVRDESEKEDKERKDAKKFSFNETDFSPFKSNRYYQKIESKLNELFSTHPKSEELSKTLSNGKFVKIKYDGDRYYLVGLIYDGEEPSYLAYGVKGVYGNTPNNFDMGKFVPVSPFDLQGEGYYLIFQDLDSGERV